MKNLFLILVLLSSNVFAVTAGKVWRVPTGASHPSWGPVKIDDTTNAVTGTLPVTNGGTGATTLTSGGLLTGNGTSAITAITQLTSKSFLPSLGQQVSSGSGNMSLTNTGSYADVTNQTVTFTSTGRPVMIMFMGDTDTAGAFQCSAGSNLAYLRVVRDGSAVGCYGLIGPGQNLPGGMNCLDTGASAASHTWKLQYQLALGTCSAYHVKMAAFEL